MEIILQLIISGIAFGCIYCLVAIEVSIIYNASGLVNFGHEKFIMLGAYVFGGTMVGQLGLNFFVAFLLTCAFMALFGSGVAAAIFNPLRNMSSDLFAMMGTVLLAKILSELARIIWGPAPFRVENFFSGNYSLGSITVPKVYVFIILASVLFLILQNILFTKTRLGKSMRCVQQDKTASSIMGINVGRNIMFTVALSAITCGLISLLIIPIFHVDLNMASMIAVKGFAASVIGGFGSMTGAIAGGLFIGLIENLFLLVGSSLYKDVVAFVLMILFLLIKPEGLMKKKA